MSKLNGQLIFGCSKPSKRPKNEFSNRASRNETGHLCVGVEIQLNFEMLWLKYLKHYKTLIF